MPSKLLFLFIFITSISFAQTADISGKITDKSQMAVPFATVYIATQKLGTVADEDGNFTLSNIKPGYVHLQISAVGYKPNTISLSITEGETREVQIELQEDELEQVEVFGNRYKHPDKIEALTRLPLEPYEQIQSISVISGKLIETQGALTISEATKNVPGVYTFATYGNRRESMSSRGFRGIPILKNGVRIHSDFRGVGVLTDMQGVDNIQVLKGAASVTQGVATDLGSPGGVINIVTKTPKYYFGGEVSTRVGSFGQVRPTFDIFGPVNDSENVAFRLNGAYETGESFREGISMERFYLNPSLQWRINEKTTVTAEMDYFDDSRTPDLGTVNLAGNDRNAIYDLPYDIFLGYDNDRSITRNSTYAVRVDRELNNNLSLKGAFYRSSLNLEDRGASLGNVVRVAGEPVYNLRNRGYSASSRSDNNTVLQLDLIGDEIRTGKITHTFQVGIDYRTTTFSTSSQSITNLDVVDVFERNTEALPANLQFGEPRTGEGESRAIGMVAQDVITFNSWFKTFFGLRYSSVEAISQIETTRNDAFNPLGGIVLSPFKNINFFASYTNSSYPRSASRLSENGEELGNERYDQLETGVKANWLDSRLRFNLTFFRINNRDINLPVYDENWVETGFYQKGGNDQRQGIEVELTGRVLENLEVITGYSFIDAQYLEHTSFVYGSAPLNTPKHTFNAYANYLFRGGLEGLSLGAGAYYTGERPINDWSSGAVTHQGIVPNQEPFFVDAYTLVNVQAGYKFNNHWSARVIANNILNTIGYNAYRTSYINQTDPRTFAGVLSYAF